MIVHFPYGNRQYCCARFALKPNRKWFSGRNRKYTINSLQNIIRIYVETQQISILNSSCSFHLKRRGILQFKLVYENWTQRPFQTNAIHNNDNNNKSEFKWKKKKKRKKKRKKNLVYLLKWHVLSFYIFCSSGWIRNIISWTFISRIDFFFSVSGRSHGNLSQSKSLSSSLLPEMSRNLSIIVFKMSSLRDRH